MVKDNFKLNRKTLKPTESVDTIDGMSIASWDPFTSTCITDDIPLPKLELITQSLVDHVHHRIE